MPLRTFDTEDAPLALREEITYSRDRCENHSLATKHVPVFAALLDEWQAVFAKFLALQDKIARAEARVDACDDELDPFVDEVAAALLLGNNNRDSEEFRSYFGSKQPHEIKRPVLGDELELVRSWLPSLKASTNSLLVALGTRGEALVAKADDASQRPARTSTASSAKPRIRLKEKVSLAISPSLSSATRGAETKS